MGTHLAYEEVGIKSTTLGRDRDECPGVFGSFNGWRTMESLEDPRVAQRAVKCLRCSTCERMSRPLSHRPSRTPTDGERFNERLFVDLCDVVDVRGNRFWWLVAVDQHTDFTVIAPCPRHESQAVATKIFKHWIQWAAPPDVFVCDGERGLGASGILTEKLSVSGTQVQTTAAYSPWQKGRVEQMIATIKEVAGKTILQHQVAGRSAMSIVSYKVAHALNQRAGRLNIPLQPEFLANERRSTAN